MRRLSVPSVWAVVGGVRRLFRRLLARHLRRVTPFPSPFWALTDPRFTRQPPLWMFLRSRSADTDCRPLSTLALLGSLSSSPVACKYTDKKRNWKINNERGERRSWKHALVSLVGHSSSFATSLDKDRKNLSRRKGTRMDPLSVLLFGKAFVTCCWRRSTSHPGRSLRLS